MVVEGALGEGVMGMGIIIDVGYGFGIEMVVVGIEVCGEREEGVDVELVDDVVLAEAEVSYDDLEDGVEVVEVGT